jgi:hypothetical protein
LALTLSPVTPRGLLGAPPGDNLGVTIPPAESHASHCAGDHNMQVLYALYDVKASLRFFGENAGRQGVWQEA